MPSRYPAAVLVLVAMVALSASAQEQSLEALRAARDQAKADLIKAQQAFDRADEVYIKALGGAAAKAPPASPASMQQQPAGAAAPRVTTAGTPPQTRPAAEVTFSLSGVGALEISPLDYRARLIVDEHPEAWTQHASGVKETVAPGAQSLAYEVQKNTTGDAVNPAWKTICQGNLSLKPRTTVDISLGQGVACTAK